METTNDAIVSFSDGLKWAERLIRARPDDVIKEALDLEPAVLGVAADVGRRAVERLARYGLSDELQEFIVTRITLAGAMALLLMREGNAKLWSDLIEPEDENKEKS